MYEATDCQGHPQDLPAGMNLVAWARPSHRSHGCLVLLNQLQIGKLLCLLHTVQCSCCYHGQSIPSLWVLLCFLFNDRYWPGGWGLGTEIATGNRSRGLWCRDWGRPLPYSIFLHWWGWTHRRSMPISGKNKKLLKDQVCVNSIVLHARIVKKKIEKIKHQDIASMLLQLLELLNWGSLITSFVPSHLVYWRGLSCSLLTTACVGIAAAEGSWETGVEHQPDPSIQA